MFSFLSWFKRSIDFNSLLLECKTSDDTLLLINKYGKDIITYINPDTGNHIGHLFGSSEYKVDNMILNKAIEILNLDIYYNIYKCILY